MKITNRRYEFTPPNGSSSIKVLGLQTYSSNEAGKVDVWRLDVPAEHAARFGGDVEFDSWKTLIATLANMFCNSDEKAVSTRMALKWSDPAA